MIGFGAKNVMPFVLSELIDWFALENGDTARAYSLASLYGGLSLFSAWVVQPLMYENMTDGHKLRCQLSSLLFRKSLRLVSKIYNNRSWVMK